MRTWLSRLRLIRRRPCYQRRPNLEQFENRLLLSFMSAGDFSTGNAPRAVSVGDFNRDGRTDVVTANGSSNTVSVLLGNTDGSFGSASSFSTGGEPLSVITGDVNDDARDDIVTANHTTNDVSVLLGNGDGSFQSSHSFGVGLQPLSVATGDFNRDGKLDLVTANFQTGDVSVLLGNGDGTFGTAHNFAAGGEPSSLALADLNRDGRLDLIVGNEGDTTVSVLLGNGDGTFQAGRLFGAGPDISSLVAADFNQDGAIDIAAACASTVNVALLLGNGDGTFQSPRAISTNYNPVSLASSDFNGDGRMDLAIISAATTNISVLLGNGDGSFQSAQYFGGGASPVALATSDFSRDSRVDLVFANPTTNSVHILLNICPPPGSGTLQAERMTAIPAGATLVVAGDFNSDGRPDLASATSFSGNTVSVLLGNGDGTFQSANSFTTSYIPTDLAVGDFNEDGKLDLLVAIPHDGVVTLYLGNGDGTFQAARNVLSTPWPRAVAVGDLNNDHHLDIVAPSSTGTTLTVLFGRGNGTFQTGPTLTAGSGPAHMVIADFNNDGQQDIAVGNVNDWTVTIFVGQGGGTFENRGTFPAIANVADLKSGDFNRDGRLDLVASDAQSGLSVLLGNGDGSFKSPRSIPLGDEADSIAVADVNKDGILDLVVPLYGESCVGVLAGNGDGTFQSPQRLVDHQPLFALAVDTNNDSNVDVVACEGGSFVGVFLGDSSGTFQAAENLPTDLYPTCVTAGIFNADSRPDLAVATSNQSLLSVYINTGGDFGLVQQIRVGMFAQSTVAADFNRDGRLDLANNGGGQLNILLGNGDGTFQATQDAQFGGLQWMAVGDINGDDSLDLVGSQNDGHSIFGTYLVLGNGDGSFQTPQNVFAGTGRVCIGDLNSDGRLDVVAMPVQSSGPSPVTVLLGNGDGTFQAPLTTLVSPWANALAVADMNRDGKLDIVVGAGYLGDTPRGTVSVLLGNGDGSFGTAITSSTQPITPTELSVVDLNGDGRQDVVASGGYISVFPGNGDGTLQNALYYRADLGSRTLAVADFNSDGIPDIAATNDSSADVSVLYGNRAAATHFQVTAPANATAGTPFNITVAALRADNLADCNYTGTVSFSGGGASATLPGRYTFQLSEEGTHTFSATLQQIGQQSLVITDGSITATVTIEVIPVPVSRLQLTAPGSATAGRPFSTTVTAVDASGNRITGYRGTIHFTSTDTNPQTVLPSDYMFTDADAGQHTFTGVVLTTAGSRTLTARDTVDSSIVGHATIKVLAGSATQFLLAAPNSVTAGTPFNLTVTALDAYGNQSGGYRGRVHFSSTDAAAVLPADYLFTASDGGRHVFSITLNTAGSQAVSVRDTANNSISGSVTINVALATTTIEGFESNNLGAYQVANGSSATASTQAAAAHDGSYGLQDSNGNDWIYRNDAAAHVQAGDRISVWLEFNSAANGQAYFGFGATSTGTLSLVASAGGKLLQLQSNPGYNTNTVLGSVVQVYRANHWYRLQVDWGTTGTITGRLFDSDGVTLLNTVTGSSTAITSGGIAFRANGANPKYWDTVERTAGIDVASRWDAAVLINLRVNDATESRHMNRAAVEIGAQSNENRVGPRPLAQINTVIKNELPERGHTGQSRDKNRVDLRDALFADIACVPTFSPGRCLNWTDGIL